MTKPLRGALMLPIPLAVLLAFGGCAESTGEHQANQPPQGVAGGPAAPTPGAAEGAGATPGIKQVMTKLTKGPNSLTPVIGRELNEAQPPWETIQAQTQEYSQLAATLGQYDPPKGSKESWEKLTSAYAGSATELDRASQAKDKDAALAAHGQLTNSCMSCHREHRVMGPGRGGMGGPPGFGRPGSGPPGSGPPGAPPPPPPGGRPPG